MTTRKDNTTPLALCRTRYAQHAMSLSPAGAARTASRRRVGDRLLASVIACVRGRGPHVSVDELARASGVAKPVLYDVFGDRRGIAAAVAGELADMIER